jgi:hypothetical protein
MLYSETKTVQMSKKSALAILCLVTCGCAGLPQTQKRTGDRILLADLVDPWALDGKLEVLAEVNDVSLRTKLLHSIQNSSPTSEGEAGIPIRCFILVTNQNGQPDRAYRFATYKNMFIPVKVEFVDGSYKWIGLLGSSQLVPGSPPPLKELSRWARGRGESLRGRFTQN